MSFRVSPGIFSNQKGRGQVQARSRADEGRAVLKYIDVEDLVPSEDNFYSMSAIDELAGLIELSGGVKQPGLVVPLGGGKYKLLSGHRDSPRVWRNWHTPFRPGHTAESPACLEPSPAKWAKTNFFPATVGGWPPSSL